MTVSIHRACLERNLTNLGGWILSQAVNIKKAPILGAYFLTGVRKESKRIENRPSTYIIPLMNPVDKSS